MSVYFLLLTPYKENPSTNWVISTKQEVIKIKRPAELIADSEAGTNKWKNNKK
ncbi:MAG: hypothetical protein H7Z76_12460 [Methylotenera sp.]|nr:hypothetical protein [Flavobacterium sp.]